jgi:hypothetical protein
LRQSAVRVKNSPDELSKLADEAINEYHTGKTTPLEPDEL